MRFSYTKYFLGTRSSDGIKHYIEYPTVRIDLVNLRTGTVFPEYLCLVDSGAAMCLFHARVGELLGIDVESVVPAPVRGVGPFPGKLFVHRVNLVITGHEIGINAGFSYDLNIPFGLLGQKGFFEKFRVCFDLPKRDFEIVPKIR